MQTNLNYCVLEISTAAIALLKLMIILSMHPLPRMNVVLDFICMGPVDLPGACQIQQNTRLDRMFGRVLHVESKHTTCASFCYLSNIDIFQYVTQNSSCTRQNTLYFMNLELIPLYTLVLKVCVCINFTLIGQLSSKPG